MAGHSSYRQCEATIPLVSQEIDINQEQGVRSISGVFMMTARFDSAKTTSFREDDQLPQRRPASAKTTSLRVVTILGELTADVEARHLSPVVSHNAITYNPWSRSATASASPNDNSRELESSHDHLTFRRSYHQMTCE
ncbi:hypothetical protein EG328_002742 [Venturia inaequalis]|uniref:Uncharacterized protein n=1 Tax=Venturia inaequalis TaxID=5025 RepID=A0A8H3UTR6_VENIN|nr:hypothetical protein EG328_002742 [Venturia inaequalis]